MKVPEGDGFFKMCKVANNASIEEKYILLCEVVDLHLDKKMKEGSLEEALMMVLLIQGFAFRDGNLIGHERTSESLFKTPKILN